MRSQSTATSEQDLGEGPDDDLDVEPERPVLDVVVVEAGPVGDRGVPPQAADLREPGEPGLDAVAVGVAVVLGGELVDEVRPLRTRADEASCRRGRCSTAGAARRARCAAGTARPGRPGCRRRSTRWWPTPFASAGRIERSLRQSNSTPSRPTRACRKITPGPPSRRTASAQIAEHRGDHDERQARRRRRRTPA